MADTKPATSYSTDPALYLYTSLTAGSSHIVTATSRLETILKANKVPFKAVDIAVDDKARMIWSRRAGKDAEGRLRKLPGLVQMGLVLGDLVEIEDWNEYGELKQHVTIYYDDFTIPTKSQAPKTVTPAAKKPAGATATAATGATSAPAPPPAAPPLPTQKTKIPPSKDSPTSPTAATQKVTSGIATAAANATQPIKSIAEEAAQKAKQVRLESLREKVYGNKDKDKENAKPQGSTEKEKETPTIPLASAASTSSVAISEGVSNMTISTPFAKSAAAAAGMLQSPTTGKWGGASSRSGGDDDAGIEGQLLQSPTSGTWKVGAMSSVDSLGGTTPATTTVREHRDSAVADASADEIAAVEKSQAIPEEEDEDEESSEGEEEKEDSEEEEEEEDDDDDDDDEKKVDVKKKGQRESEGLV